MTFGKNDRFLTHYATTIGPWIALPEAWFTDLERYRHVIAHEEHHVKQLTKAGLGSPVLGIVPMGLAYLFLPLPIGLAWCRYALEREAYAVGIRVALEDSVPGSSTVRRHLIDRAVEQLTGPAYAYTWVFKKQVRCWFEENV